MIINLYIEGILPKGPYLPCVSMAGRAPLAGYPRHSHSGRMVFLYRDAPCTSYWFNSCECVSVHYKWMQFLAVQLTTLFQVWPRTREKPVLQPMMTYSPEKYQFCICGNHGRVKIIKNIWRHRFMMLSYSYSDICFPIFDNFLIL